MPRCPESSSLRHGVARAAAEHGADAAAGSAAGRQPRCVAATRSRAAAAAAASAGSAAFHP
eukprot:527976-Prymnesium_polylepis.2